jgi:hypothetical protein
MKRKFYFMIMLVVCVSIATPALANPMFGKTYEKVGSRYYDEASGGCLQEYAVERHFFWFSSDGGTVTLPISCDEPYYGE